MASGVMKSSNMHILPQSIRGKLTLAFGVIAVVTLIGGLVGQSSYDAIRQKLSIITEVSVPSLVSAQRIGEVTAQIATAAPILHGAETKAALTMQQEELVARMSELETAIENLARLSEEAESVRRVNVLAQQVASTLVVQIDSVHARLDLTERSRAAVDALAAEHLRFNAAIQPIIKAEEQAFLISSEGVIDNTERSVARVNQISMKGLLPILLLRVQASNLAYAIGSTRKATTQDEVDSLWQKFVAANSVASRQFNVLEQNDALAGFLDIQPLRKIFKQFTNLGAGDGNAFDRRHQELAGAGADITGSAREKHVSQLETQLATLETALERILNPMITLIRGRMAIEGFDLNQYVSGTLTTMATDGLSGIRDLQKLETLGNHIVGVLTATALLEDGSELPTFQSSFATAAAELEAILQKYESDPAMSPVMDSARRLMGFGNGETSLFAMSMAKLETVARGQELLGESLRLTEELRAPAAQIVAATRSDSSQAARAAGYSLTTVWWTLFSTAMASIFVLVLVWLYIRQNLGTRLSALSESMLAIAGGNLKAGIPSVERDEIGHMVEALTGFRDTAVEVKETNLREIREARNRLTNAIETISEGFSLYDTDDRLVVCNSRYRDFMYPGIAGAMAPGTPFETIVRKAAALGLIADAEGRIDEWVKERLEKHRNPSGPHLQQRGDGRWIQISERKMETGGTVAVYSDLTEIKHAEEALREAKDQAEVANRAKSQFLASMSHELRTPLNAILGYTELIIDNIYGEVPDEIESVLQRVDRNGRHLLALINDVLDLSKMEAGQLSLSFNDYSMKEIVDSVIVAVESLGAEKNLALIADVASELPIGKGDEQRITQVLLNLIGNALKFTDEGEVSVQVSASDGSFHVSIADTGIGISEADQQVIFEEFHQADGTDTRSKGGTGLGLAIARRIVEMHGGRLRVESRLGQGSTFTFVLPVRVEQQTEAA